MEEWKDTRPKIYQASRGSLDLKTRFHNEKQQIHMGFYLCIEKCLSKKFEVFFCWRLLGFFCAHAVRAQSSDGHKNVLSLIGYSHMLENR